MVDVVEAKQWFVLIIFERIFIFLMIESVLRVDNQQNRSSRSTTNRIGPQGRQPIEFINRRELQLTASKILTPTAFTLKTNF